MRAVGGLRHTACHLRPALSCPREGRSIVARFVVSEVMRVGEASNPGPVHEDAHSSRPASGTSASLAGLWAASFSAECDWDGDQDFHDDDLHGEYVDLSPDDGFFPGDDTPEDHDYADGADTFDDVLDRMMGQFTNDEPRVARREEHCDDLFEAPLVDEAVRLREERSMRWLRTSPTAVPIPADVFEEIREKDRQEMDRQAAKWRHILATSTTEGRCRDDVGRRRRATSEDGAPPGVWTDEPSIEETRELDSTDGHDARTPAAAKWDPPPKAATVQGAGAQRRPRPRGRRRRGRGCGDDNGNVEIWCLTHRAPRNSEQLSGQRLR